MRPFATAFVAVALLLAGPALAAPHGEPAPHGAADTHAPKDGHAPAGDHAAEGDHGADGGHDKGHVYSFASDDHFDKSIRDISFHAVNLVLFFGVIVYMGRRPIRDGLSSRALAIGKELTDSARMRDEAKQKSADLGDRLDRIEAEIADLHTQAKADSANEEAALVARAETEANRIAESAERSIRDEVTRARFALKRDAVALAVELAESALKGRMDAEQQQRLAHDFLESIKSDGENRV